MQRKPVQECKRWPRNQTPCAMSCSQLDKNIQSSKKNQKKKLKPCICTLKIEKIENVVKDALYQIVILVKIIFVSLSNLLVWESKDEMLLNQKEYYPILKKALQMNSIRNTATNSLMDDFKETDFTRNRVSKFTKTDPLWKKHLIKKLSQV